MNSPTSEVWRGSTHADRSALRREQLVGAGFELLGEQGAAATTMRAVCRSAGLSLRYFYENFPDRDALLIAVYDLVADELRTAITTAVFDAPEDMNSRIRAAFHATATFLETDPRRGRIMFRETLADDTLRAHGLTYTGDFVTAIAALVPSASTGTADTAATAQTALPVSALSGALVSLYLDWLDGRLDTTRDGLVDYASDLTVAVLGIGSATG